MMTMSITASNYVDYLVAAGAEIAKNRDYITALDAKTGDGDHWVNLNMGFERITALADELRAMGFAAMLQKVGMTMMSSIGGSSGVLYGSAYLAAAKAVGDSEEMDMQRLLRMLEAMKAAIMERGKAEPGFKTMLDSLHQSAQAMKEALAAGQSDAEVLLAMKRGARQGMEATKEMEAVKGRASYRTNKGVGDLDPGAVTMCMQLECLADCAIKNMSNKQ